MNQKIERGGAMSDLVFEAIAFIVVVFLVFAGIVVLVYVAASVRLRREIAILEYEIADESDFLVLAKQDVEQRMDQGQEFEDAWEETMNRYFRQHFRWAVYELTGAADNYPIDPRVARALLSVRFRERVLQSMLPDIVPEV